MKVTVEDLTERATVLAGGAGLGRVIASPQVSAPELSSTASWQGIASSVVHLKPGQLAYLASLQAALRARTVRALLRRKPAGIVVSGGEGDAALNDQAGGAEGPPLPSREAPEL